MMHIPERIGRALASPSRGRPAFGKRQPGSSRAKEEGRAFARDLDQSIRRGDRTHVTRRLVMVGAIAMAVALASPFLYSAVNTVQVARVDLDAVTVEDVANFVTAAGGRSRQEMVH